MKNMMIQTGDPEPYGNLLNLLSRDGFFPPYPVPHYLVHIKFDPSIISHPDSSV